MLPNTHRLRHEEDIKRLFAKGRSAFDAHVGIKVMANGRADTRFTVVVGTKVSKLAVERNRMKRRIRGVVESLLGQLQPGFDVAFLPKKSLLTLSSVEVRQSIERLLRKSGVLSV